MTLAGLWSLLTESVKRMRELQATFAIPAIVAAMAIGAIVSHHFISDIAATVTVVAIGLSLLMAVLMFRTAVNARGAAARPYQKLFFIVACAFSAGSVVCAGLALSSLFYHSPLDFRRPGGPGPEPVPSGDYRIDETVVLTDLRNRVPTENRPGVESRQLKVRVDWVVRQRPTKDPYLMQSGTNGLRIEGFTSPTHPSMDTREIQPGLFAQTTKHTYLHTIDADRFPIGERIRVELHDIFVNAFSNDQREWVGTCPNIDTAVLTLVVLFPVNKPCRTARGMEQTTGNAEIPFVGTTAPAIHSEGAVVTWTIPKPSKGTGYFIAFDW